MSSIWRRNGATAREVHNDVRDETAWAYTTAKTVLDRLVEKGALTMVKPAKTNIYNAILSRRDARSVEVGTLMERAFDGAFGPLIHFLLNERALSDAEREELRKIIDEEAADQKTPADASA
jgi:BlaI family transcriptional regulator, penicillinase repressor